MWKLSPLRVRLIGWFPSRWVAWGFRVLLDTGANDLGLFCSRRLKALQVVKSETIAHDSAEGEQKAFTMPPMMLV